MKKRIIVAEDDPALQDIFQLLLGKKGYEVVLIFDRIEDIDYAELNADLYLLDLHLSGYSGLDICRQLKDTELTRAIPVIMISANPDIHFLAESCGANAAIEKPFNTTHLLETIASHLDKKAV
jgi:DNA-binding response OmpR family regulator